MYPSARQLEIFDAAYRLRSTHKAAAELNLSQPAVSRAVQDLEAAIGVVLFDRASRRFEPNLAAKTLHQAARRHFVGLDHVARIARGLRSGTTGHIVVHALPVIADGPVAEAAGQAMALNPGLRIDIEAAGEIECLAALRAGRADVAVVSSVHALPEFESIRVGALSPVVLSDGDDPLMRKPSISIRDLAEEGLLLLPQGSPFRDSIERAFAAEGLGLPIRAEARTQRALVAMAIAGAGRAIVSRQALPQLLPPSRYRLIDELPDWPLHVMAADASAPPLAKLTGLLREVCAPGPIGMG
jgi:DNA-binding transcriptional LysR family regulator